MARLILMFNNQVIKEFHFEKQGLTIGRKAENDIHIDNLAVSGHHARIDKTGTNYIVTDLQSTNGTFVGDKKIVTHILKHGDKVLIGKHVLLFVSSEKEDGDTTAVSEQLAMDKTMILDTSRQRNLLAKHEAPSKTIPKPDQIGVLTFLDNSDIGDIFLTKKLTRIGKSAHSEIQLSGLFMSSTVATISKRPTGYAITFAGGMVKVKINGEVLKSSIPLKEFDTIEIGSYKTQFYYKDTE